MKEETKNFIILMNLEMNKEKSTINYMGCNDGLLMMTCFQGKKYVRKMKCYLKHNQKENFQKVMIRFWHVWKDCALQSKMIKI